MNRKKIIELGVSSEAIDFVDDAFGKGYLDSDRHCRDRLKRLLKLCEVVYSDTSMYDVTGSRISGAQLLSNLRGDLFLPNKVSDNGIIIDLFSRGEYDVLSEKDISGSELIKPKILCSVDKKGSMNEKGNKLYKHVLSDGLCFVGLLPNESVNYFLSGLDFRVISNIGGHANNYFNVLNEELYRTIQKGGFITGSNYQYSPQLGEYFLKGTFPKNVTDWYYFEKE